MIKYTLKCGSGCTFEAWFADSAAFEDQRARGLVTCGVCGDPNVEKALMAPAVAGGGGEAAARDRGRDGGRDGARDGAREAGLPGRARSAVPVEALRRLRADLEAKADFVGDRFAAEARRRWLGDGPERPVWGSATPQDARALAEEGVPIAPLPDLPKRDD